MSAAEDLPTEAWEAVAAHLLDARDIAALRRTAKSFAALYRLPRVWRRLIATRFGPGCLPPDEEQLEARFRELATLRRPVVGLETKVWFSAQRSPDAHLHPFAAIGSAAGEVVRLYHVCWLELAGAVPGVLPGCYKAYWRLKLCPHFFVDEFDLQCSVPPGCGAGSSLTVSWQQLRALYGEVGARWVSIFSAPIEVTQLCCVGVALKGTSGNWKRDLLFDVVGLTPCGEGEAAEGQPAALQYRADG